MMKKTLPALIAHIAVILAVIIVMGTLGLIAAGVASEGSEKFTDEIERNVTLRILENDTAKEQGYLKELLDAFNAEYAEYGIKAVDANMDQFTDLETGGPYGYGPDVLYQANDAIMKYVDGTRKHILPLPVEQLDCYEHIGKNAWDAYKVTIENQDFICGVPVNIQQPLLFYRKDLLPANWETEWDDDKNGVPDMIEYWTDLYRYSQTIRAQSASNYGYMKSLNDGYFASGYFLSYGGYVFGGEERNDTSDVGFSKNDGYLGAKIIRQLASVMNLECTEDTITKNSYSRMAQGAYFATMTTPDVYTMFIKEMVNAGFTEEYARENLIMTDVPKLPVSGDLEDESQGFKDMTVMGGINGYAISSYTKAPNAALAFVNFATSYKMINRRAELLGISPARGDSAEALGGLNANINNNLTAGTIYVMPSVRALGQVWTPLQTYCAILADDSLTGKNVYVTDEALKKGLENVDNQIYAAIHTLG
ncbi:MAG TPA: sugar ABC transporter substrate-binding protein [Clostridiales bacterium]|nr:sugar ABC transporter substrate-binding protein [Clostridiales bacterium]